MSGEALTILVSVVALVAAGLAAYWKGQAALSKELLTAIEAGDRKVAETLREEARERKQDTDRRIEDHEGRIRSLETTRRDAAAGRNR